MPGAVSPGMFRPGDAVFFDDCLASQYLFVRRHMPEMRGVRVVLGFSPGLARPDGAPPIEYMDSAAAHAAVNAAMRAPGDAPPDEIRAFMSEAEVRELAAAGAEVALHGCMHLNLRETPGRTERLAAFRRDAEDGARMLEAAGFAPGAFVYPYAFCEDGYGYIVEKLGFREQYARPGAYRIAVENLEDEHSRVEDS
jgi:hypothetical protein